MPPKKPTPAPKVTANPATIKRALQDLGIDKPYYTVKVVDGRLRFTLYGGEVVTWPKET
jgi:hypothetical protein